MVIDVLLFYVWNALHGDFVYKRCLQFRLPIKCVCVCVTSAFRLYGQHCVFFSEFLNRPLEQSLP